MRLILLPLALSLASPALAQEHASSRQVHAEDMARALGNPAVQAGVTTIVSDIVAAILDTHVGPMARYTDPRDDLRPSDTLRDVAEREDPAFERHLQQRTRGAVAAAGLAARDAATVNAELGATAERLRRVLDRNGLTSDREDRDGY